MKVVYELPGELVEVLHVVQELRAMTGMEPEAATLNDGRMVRFTYGDFRLLSSGDVDEKWYIDKNLII